MEEGSEKGEGVREERRKEGRWRESRRKGEEWSEGEKKGDRIDLSEITYERPNTKNSISE